MTDEELQQTDPRPSEADLKRYQAAYIKIMETVPDLTKRIDALPQFKINNAGVRKIVAEARADYSYYLSTDRGRAELHELMNVAASPRHTLEVLAKNLARFDRRVCGNLFDEYRPELRPEDKYLEQRRADLRAGKRRR